MKSCKSSVIINASLETVWNVLTAFDRYPEWNPLIKEIRGIMKEGNIVLANVIPLKSNIPILIKSYKYQKEIVWQGTLLFPKIILGEHYYLLKEIGKNQTELQHGEKFTGWLTNWIPNSVLSKMQDSYEYHNQKLKIISEQYER